MEFIAISLGIVSAAALTLIGNTLGDWFHRREQK